MGCWVNIHYSSLNQFLFFIHTQEAIFEKGELSRTNRFELMLLGKVILEELSYISTA